MKVVKKLLTYLIFPVIIIGLCYAIVQSVPSRTSTTTARSSL